MDLENVLNSDHNKLIFLKAIMLGISYGSSDKKNYYIENIENEIKKITDKINNVNNKVNNNNISQKNILLQKTEQKILFLENKKASLLTLMNQLTSNNYGFNYSRINLLRTNLGLLNNEIEKNKLLLKKNQEDNSEKIIKEYNKIVHKNTENIKENLKNLKKQNILENNQKNNTNNNIKNKENLVNELEKTLGNLSSMIIN